MDLKLVENMLQIAEEGNITKAAEKLYITQSALNQQLLKLEKELGTQLFCRSKNKLYLTEAGMIYIQKSIELLNIKEDTYRKIYDIANVKQGKLKVGFTPGRGIHMFSSIYPEFHAKYPYIKVEPRELSVKEQQRQIREGWLDIGFMTLSEEQMTNDYYSILSTEKIYLAVPSTLVPLHFSQTSYKDFEVYPLTHFEAQPFTLMRSGTTSRELADKLFKEAGFVPEILFETASTATILKMVEASLCCGLIPEYYIVQSPNIVYLSLPENPTWQIAACHRKGGYLSKAGKAFIKLAGSYFIDKHWIDNEF